MLGQKGGEERGPKWLMDRKIDTPQKASHSGNTEKLVQVVGREHLTDHPTPISLLPCFAFPDMAITFGRSFSYFNDSLPVLTFTLFEILKAYIYLNPRHLIYNIKEEIVQNT